MRLYPPSILVIACAPAIVERCRIAAGVSGLSVHSADLSSAPALATERRPIALVSPDDLLSFEVREIADLARDVGATMIEVDAAVCEREIGAMLAGAIDTSIRRRGAREGAGRYSIIRKGPVEIVTLPRARPRDAPTTRPPPSGERARVSPFVMKRLVEVDVPVSAGSAPAGEQRVTSLL